MTQVFDSSDFESIGFCRTCRSTDLHEILDLGDQPLANSLLNPLSTITEKKFPLKLVGCLSCKLIQLSINVKPELMFKNYPWVTGTSDTAREHCNTLAKIICQKLSLNSERILEIGSNDGTLLKAFSKLNKNLTLIGVDPAENLFDDHAFYKIKIFKEFFTKNFSLDFTSEENKVDVVIARNVFSHVPDLIDVLDGVRQITHNDSVLIIEFHTAGVIFKNLHYDSIYHEHTYYHSINSIAKLINKIGFFINDLAKSPISGGSHIIFASKKQTGASDTLVKSINKEREIKLDNLDTWQHFSSRAKENILLNKEMLHKFKNTNSCAYGASARSSTILNAISATSNNFSGIADLNPLKWGKLSPGTRLLINDPKKIVDREKEYIYVTAINFETEILHYLKNELKWRGSLIVPIPSPPKFIKI